MIVKFGNGKKDVGILDVTAENYIVPRGEEDTYHCRIEVKRFDANTGKRMSVPRIQKFDAKMYPMIARNLKQQGYTIDVLYDPTDFLNEKFREMQEREATTLAERKAKEEEKRAAEKKALKEEILAELKEAGLLKTAKEPKTGGAKK